LVKEVCKHSKTRWIVFISICVALAVTLPFSSWFERKIYDTVGADVYYDYQTALAQDCVVHILDVGSADCIVLELPDGTKGIIDSGDRTTASREHVIEYIQENVFGSETGTFDFMILTHSDADHCGGMEQVFDTFQINYVYRPTIFYYKSTATEMEQTQMNSDELARAKSANFVSESTSDLSENTLKTVSTNVYFDFLNSVYNEPNCTVAYTSDDVDIQNSSAGYEMKFYSPYQLTYSEANNYSPVIILSYNNHSIALVGDAEAEVEEYVVDNYDLPQVDALKVGHHGSSTSSTANFLEELNPTYAFISVGENDTYDNPDEETLDRLKASGISQNNILQTSKNGDILFAIGDMGLYISASGDVSIEPLQWWYVCFGIVVLSGTVIFGIRIKKQKKKKIRLN